MKRSAHPAVSALRQALPYLELFEGKTFVVKVGGAIFEDEAALRGLCEQVGILHQVGIRIVLVHGGGPQISALSERLGHEPQKIAGRRVTDAGTLDAVAMTLCGSLRTRLLGCFRGLSVPAVGVSGMDGRLIRARKRPRVMVDGEEVDYGLVGDVVETDVTILRTLLDGGFLPVVSSLAANDRGQPLNMNADGVAAVLARELEAEKLLFLSEVPGILGDHTDPDSLISWLDVKLLNAMMEQGQLEGGMRPKAAAVKDALYAGVPRVHLLGWKIPDGLLSEIFTNEGSGTLVVLEDTDLLPDELVPTTRSARILEEGGRG